MVSVQGFADEAFTPVAEAFADNFGRGLETGAACAVYHRGRLVVDLHAGTTRDGVASPWRHDTLAVLYSVTKGLVALCGQIAHQRGLLDLDAPVISVWPAFGAHGKQDTTIRDLFSHRAGLIALDTDLTLDDAVADQVAAKPALVRSITLGGLFPLTFVDDGGRLDFNARAVHAVQIPGANGIATARAIARIYAAAVSEIDGHPRLLTDASIADATTVRSEGDIWPGSLASPGMRFSTGFMINGIPHRPLLSDASFGHDGASGSLGYADARSEIGFAYLNNRFAGLTDDRANHLTLALRQSLSL